MATQSRSNSTTETLIAAFHSHAEAQRAVRELRAAGFTDQEIGIAAHDKEGSYQEQTEGNKAGEGAAAGATVGLGAGALWGLGIVAGVLPAIGPVIAGGALAAIAASAAGTAAVGGVVGALVGLGIPEQEAEFYQGEFERGRTIVSVRANGERVDTARRILDQSNAYDYQRRQSDFARDPNATQRVDVNGKLVARDEVIDVDRHASRRG